MNGGPATVYGARAFDAFQEFFAERSNEASGDQPTGAGPSANNGQRAWV
jgi:hypothetical protein